MPTYTVVGYGVQRNPSFANESPDVQLAEPFDRALVTVIVDGFPTWAIWFVIVLSEAGPTIAELKICPWQQPELDDSQFDPSRFPLGHVTVGSRRVDPMKEDVPQWSGDASEVPLGGVPARLLRAINPGQLLDLALSRAAEERADSNKMSTDWEAAVGHRHPYYDAQADVNLDLASGTVAKRAGRRGNGIEHYLMWAIRYAEKVNAGVRNPIASLAREYGVTVQFVRDTVTDARRRHGLLTQTPGQGKAGGKLSAKALELSRNRNEARSVDHAEEVT